MFTEDLAAFLADFGVPVQFAGAPADARGLEDFEDVVAVGEDGRAVVVGRQRTVLVPTAVAALLALGAAVTVNGAARTVRDVRAADDGAFSVVALGGGS